MKIQKCGQEKLSSEVVVACDGALSALASDPLDWAEVQRSLKACSKTLQGAQLLPEVLDVGSPLDVKLRLVFDKLLLFFVKVMDIPEQSQAMEDSVELSKALGAKVSQGVLEKCALLLAKTMDGVKCVATLKSLQQLGPDKSECFAERKDDLIASQRTLQHLQTAITQASSLSQAEAKGKIHRVATDMKESIQAHKQCLAKDSAVVVNQALDALKPLAAGGLAGTSWLQGFKGTSFAELLEHADATILKSGVGDLVPKQKALYKVPRGTTQTSKT
eukprot:5842157-Amphidinium_carterae.3